jgi:adenine-specific DNA-methyltransferase
LLKETKAREHVTQPEQFDLFSDFNGIPDGADKTEFYQHEQNWTNRMILGDSLQVMASLAEREGLRGKVQCIYFAPALRHQIQQQLPVEHHESQRERR